MGEQVRGAGRDDRDRHAGAGERVHAPLHHAVAAPHQDQLGAVPDRLAGLLRRLAALGHLVPEQVADVLVRDPPAQLVEPAVERLALVRDHGHTGSAHTVELPGRCRSHSRLPVPVLPFGLIDLTLGVLFLVAYLRTPPSPGARP